MKLILISLLAVVLATYFIIPGTLTKIKKTTQVRTLSKPKGFAVVELFTSEGCSSCPAADHVVAKIQSEENDQPVYILAYHVDYWNRLGWKDVFSSSAYSGRQNEYAAWFNSGSIYTPQIVVNGKKEFVGSEEATLRNDIAADLSTPGTASVSLKNVTKDEQNINLNYVIHGANNNSVIQLAVVQKSGQTVVKRGENGGRTLSHVQIVRSFKSIKYNGKIEGTENITFPKELNGQQFEIIAFLQNLKNGEIIAATKSTL